MRFLAITHPDPSAPPPTPEALSGLEKLMEEGFREGWLVDTGTIDTEQTGSQLKFENGKLTVTDGPYAESKELIAGYAIMQVDTKDELLELLRRFYETMGGGSGEYRQLFGPDDDPTQA